MLRFVIPSDPLSALAQDSPADPEPTAVTTPSDAADADTRNAPFTTVGVNHEGHLTLEATQDAFISSAFPNTNFGSTQNLNLGWQSNGQEAMRIRPQSDWSAIPDNAVINSACWGSFSRRNRSRSMMATAFSCPVHHPAPGTKRV